MIERHEIGSASRVIESGEVAARKLRHPARALVSVACHVRGEHSSPSGSPRARRRLISMPGERLCVGRLLEPVLLQPQIELSTREAEPLGGACSVPATVA